MRLKTFATPHPNPLPLRGKGANRRCLKPFALQGKKVPEGRMRGG